MKNLKFILMILIISGCSGTDHENDAEAVESHNLNHVPENYDSQPVDDIINAAMKHFEAGRLDEAVSMLNDVLADKSSDRFMKAKASLLLAKHYQEGNDYSKAITFYEKYSSLFYTLNPEEKNQFDHFHENGSLVLFRAGRIAESEIKSNQLAEDLYLKSVGLAKEHDGSHLYYIYEEIGDFYLRQKIFNKAIIYFKKAIEEIRSIEYTFVGSSTRPMYKLLSVYILVSDWNSARGLYSEIMKRFGDTEYAIDKHYVELARKLITETPELDPGNAE